MHRAQMFIDRWIVKEDMVYIPNGILLSLRKVWNPAICKDVDGSRGYYARVILSNRERQIPYDCTHILNTLNKTDEHRGREGRKIRQKHWSRQAIRLNYREQTGLPEGRWVEWGGSWLMGIRRARDVMRSDWCMQLMNHWILPLKLIILYMSTEFVFF